MKMGMFIQYNGVKGETRGFLISFSYENEETKI